MLRRLLRNRSGGRVWQDLSVLRGKMIRTHRVVGSLSCHRVAVSRSAERLRMHSRRGSHVRLETTGCISKMGRCNLRAAVVRTWGGIRDWTLALHGRHAIRRDEGLRAWVKGVTVIASGNGMLALRIMRVRIYRKLAVGIRDARSGGSWPQHRSRCVIRCNSEWKLGRRAVELLWRSLPARRMGRGWSITTSSVRRMRESLGRCLRILFHVRIASLGHGMIGTTYLRHVVGSISRILHRLEVLVRGSIHGHMNRRRYLLRAWEWLLALPVELLAWTTHRPVWGLLRMRRHRPRGNLVRTRRRPLLIGRTESYLVLKRRRIATGSSGLAWPRSTTLVLRTGARAR